MHLARALGLALSLAVAACQSSASDGHGPPSACKTGDRCGPVLGGTTPVDSDGGAGGAGGESGAPGSVSGAVVVLTSAELDQSAAFSGKATISGPRAGGGVASVPYESATTGFVLDNLVGGSQFLLVHDETNGGTGIYSTFSLQKVPSAKAVLPVIDRTVLDGIASSLPAATSVEPGLAHLILEFARDDLPLAGVQLTQAVGGAALVAYDQGLGVYSNQASQTGTAGVLLILNVAPPAATGGVSGTVTIRVADPQGTPFALEVPAAADSVTLAGFAL